MNELKENIVILSKKEYDDLQTSLNLANKVITENGKLYSIFEKCFWDNLFENEDYDFKHIEEENLDDYHFRNLVCKALESGITDIEYISQKIIEYKKQIEEKENE